MFHLRKIQPYQLRHFSTLKVPITFYQVPYDEQYESRDFIREKVKENNDINDNNNNDKEGKKNENHYSVVQDWVQYPLKDPTRFLKVNWTSFIDFINSRQQITE